MYKFWTNMVNPQKKKNYHSKFHKRGRCRGSIIVKRQHHPRVIYSSSLWLLRDHVQTKGWTVCIHYLNRTILPRRFALSGQSQTHICTAPSSKEENNHRSLPLICCRGEEQSTIHHVTTMKPILAYDNMTRCRSWDIKIMIIVQRKKSSSW